MRDDTSLPPGQFELGESRVWLVREVIWPVLEKAYWCALIAFMLNTRL